MKAFAPVLLAVATLTLCVSPVRAEDWLSPQLSIRPETRSEKLEPNVPLAAEPPAAPARAPARHSCALGLCMSLGRVGAEPRAPLPPLVGALDWSTPTTPVMPVLMLFSVSLEPAGARQPRG